MKNMGENHMKIMGNFWENISTFWKENLRPSIRMPMTGLSSTQCPVSKPLTSVFIPGIALHGWALCFIWVFHIRAVINPVFMIGCWWWLACALSLRLVKIPWCQCLCEGLRVYICLRFIHHTMNPWPVRTLAPPPTIRCWLPLMKKIRTITGRERVCCVPELSVSSHLIGFQLLM